MHVDDTHPDAAASPAGGPRSGRAPISRRQAIGRLSALATAGAAAWVVPEILTAKPAAGAVALSAADDRPGLVRVRRPDRERGDHCGRHHERGDHCGLHGPTAGSHERGDHGGHNQTVIGLQRTQHRARHGDRSSAAPGDGRCITGRAGHRSRRLTAGSWAGARATRPESGGPVDDRSYRTPNLNGLSYRSRYAPTTGAWVTSSTSYWPGYVTPARLRRRSTATR